MLNRNQLKRTILLTFLALFTTISSFAQSSKFPEPREEKLLNGLKLLTWVDTAAPKLTIKVRIHSGSAFDPKDKMGVMALLSDILFPTDQAKAYFTEDLEGSLDIATNYDYIQITATGKSSELLSMIETLANSIANPQITPENFVKVRDERLKKVRELEKNPAYIADLAIAKSLFGDFPYGRSIEGTSESLAKIDRADLLFAKERFLSSDNATIVVIGNVKPDYTYRVVRQLFGTWTKSDKLTQPTFRQAEPVKAEKTQKLFTESQEKDKRELREAIRGIARNNKDFFSSKVLTTIASNRLKNNKDFSNSFIINKPHILSGSIIFGNSFVRNLSKPVSNEDENIIQVSMLLDAIDSKISNNEFDTAKTEVLNEINNNHISDLWLDVDTYKLISVQNEIQSVQNVTIADVRSLAEKLSKAATVTVLVAKPETTASQKTDQ